MTFKDLYHLVSPKFQKLFLDYKVRFKPRYGNGLPPHALLYRIINANRNLYAEFLKKALQYIPAFHEIKKKDSETNAESPVWNSGYLPGLDIVGLYTMIAENKPARYVEIGSGYSTKVAYRAIKDNGLNTEIICIDPQPRTEVNRLADRIIEEPFEDTNHGFLESLNEHDILFVDNSHRILPNSDSMVFFLEVLPLLKKGVLVHLHDIYLPYDYPQFMCNRFYSEQYGLAMYLLSDPEKYKPVLPLYFIHKDEELSKIIAPVWEHPDLSGVEKHGGSFWMRIDK